MSDNFIGIIEEGVSTLRVSNSLVCSRDQNSVQIYGETSSGAGTATVSVQASNVSNPTKSGHWVSIGDITLTLGTNGASDSRAILVPYKRVRFEVTAITGTGAKISGYTCEG